MIKSQSYGLVKYVFLSGDDPWTEHARWFPFCKFVMKIKGIQFIDEIQQRYEMVGTFC